MTNYWAQFRKIDQNIFRFDTRIYLNEIDTPQSTDICIGAVVGKNPGAAQPSNIDTSSLQEIVIGNDKLLPNLKSIITQAYAEAKCELPQNGFIQVLNLFYLCNQYLDVALKEINAFQNKQFCMSEQNDFPWIWYVWGGDYQPLNNYKNRFNNIKAKVHFFYDTNTNSVIQRKPNESELARHTQGLDHSFVIPDIAKIIENS